MEADIDFLADALIRWEDSKESGTEKSALELCSARPHLIDDLQKQINALKKTSFLEDQPLEDFADDPQSLFSSGYENQLVGSRYRLQKKLAEGGFAEVWLGFDQELQRQVAVKLPKPSHIHSIEVFVSEARRVAKLNHPGIVPVHDIVRENALIYIISEYVSEGNLKDKLAKSNISESQAKDWILQIADALHYAHQNQIIHRDIKPANILINQNGNAKIADFGIALSPNKTGEFAPSMGTLPYMSPEHLDGKTLDARSDIYSLGVLYYELLHGEIPYPSGGLNTLRNNISLGRVALAPTNNKISKNIRKILTKCLAKAPYDRFKSAEQFANALRIEPPSHQSKTLLYLIVFFILLLSSLISYFWLSKNKGVDHSISVPRPLEELLSLGRQSFAKPDYQQAVQDFSNAIAIDATCVEAFHRRAAANFNLGKYSDSIPDFNKAVELAPNNAEILRNRALPLVHLKLFNEAIQDLELAIKIEPATAIKSKKLLSSIYYAIAFDLEMNQNYSQAIKESTKAISYDTSPKNYQQRGILYYKMMEYQKSIDDLTLAIQLGPEVAWHYENRALSFEALGKISEAKADDLKASEIKTKSQKKNNSK